MSTCAEDGHNSENGSTAKPLLFPPRVVSEPMLENYLYQLPDYLNTSASQSAPRSEEIENIYESDASKSEQGMDVQTEYISPRPPQRGNILYHYDLFSYVALVQHHTTMKLVYVFTPF